MCRCGFARCLSHGLGVSSVVLRVTECFSAFFWGLWSFCDASVRFWKILRIPPCVGPVFLRVSVSSAMFRAILLFLVPLWLGFLFLGASEHSARCRCDSLCSDASLRQLVFWGSCQSLCLFEGSRRFGVLLGVCERSWGLRLRVLLGVLGSPTSAPIPATAGADNAKKCWRHPPKARIRTAARHGHWHPRSPKIEAAADATTDAPPMLLTKSAPTPAPRQALALTSAPALVPIRAKHPFPNVDATGAGASAIGMC